MTMLFKKTFLLENEIKGVYRNSRLYLFRKDNVLLFQRGDDKGVTTDFELSFKPNEKCKVTLIVEEIEE